VSAVSQSPIRARIALCFALSCIALTACGGNRLVRVPMMRPAEVNLSAYPTLGITQLNGDRDGQIASLIEGRLLDGGRFQVVDRTHMNQVMNELKLSASDLAQGGAVKLGGLVTASALISGSIEDHYRDLPKTRTWRDKNNAEHTERWNEGEHTVRAALKVIDVSTGRLLYAHTFESKQASGGDQHVGLAILGAVLAGPMEHRPPDRQKLASDAREQVVHQFVAAISPQKETVSVAFLSDAKIPQLDTGVIWAQRGEWKKAQDTFNDGLKAAENNPAIESAVLAKAYYNLGLAYVLAGDYDNGIKLLTKGFDLSNDPKYLDQVDWAKRLQADAKRLGEQTAPPAGS
jgi:curli biogenesis system outer membrane secretion channel CsgG